MEEVEKLWSEVSELSRLNERLTERLQKSERKCEALQEDATTFCNRLDVHERRNDLWQYGRWENLHLVKLGPDSSSETMTQCKNTVLAIINKKLKLRHIMKQHIELDSFPRDTSARSLCDSYQGNTA